MDRLEQLFARLQERAIADPSASYTAQLLARGPGVVARKLGEEAIECLIAITEGKRHEVVTEAADVVYHLMVGLLASGVELDEVLSELERRQGQTGLEEKAGRKP